MTTTDGTVLHDPGRLAAVEAVEASFGHDTTPFDRITRLVAHLLDAPLASFALVEQDRNFVPSAFGVEMTETSAEEGVFCRHLVEHGDVLQVCDTWDDPRFRDTPLVAGPPHIRFYAGAVVRDPDGARVGTICIVDVKPRELDTKEIDVLRDIRDDAEDILRLQRLSFSDGLTRLFNRRYLDEVLTRETLRANRKGNPISLCLFDIDHFKAFNDAVGHAEGDVCLRSVAAVLAEAAHRSSDLAARVGGEEFALLLPDTDEDGTTQLGNDVVERVRALALHHPGRPGEFVTVSAGSATSFDDSQPQNLFEMADAALYLAKNSGRNRHVHLAKTPD